MIGVVLKLAVALAVCAAGVGFLTRISLPPDIDQPSLLQIGAALRRITTFFQVEWICRVVFGHTNQFQFRRAVANYMITSLPLDAEPDLEVTDDVFGGRNVRMYRPRSAPVPTPALMHFHGGGWALGSIDQLDRGSRYIARKAQIVVVVVSYRLAPEHPFPAALEDCVAATVHVLKKGLELGIDVNRVGVGGVSAGGNLAAAVPLRLQDEEFKSLPKLRFQLPIVPVLQSLDFNLPSQAHEPFYWGFISSGDLPAFHAAYAGLDLSPSTIQQIMNNQHVRPETRARLAKYVHRNLVEEELGQKLGEQKPEETQLEVNETLAALAEPVLLHPLLSPLLADEESLKRLPRAMVVSAQYDLIRDDSLLYVRRLRAARVPVTSLVVKTAHHLSLVIVGPEPGSKVVKDAYDQIIDFIKDTVKG